MCICKIWICLWILHINHIFSFTSLWGDIYVENSGIFVRSIIFYPHASVFYECADWSVGSIVFSCDSIIYSLCHICVNMYWNICVRNLIFNDCWNICVRNSNFMHICMTMEYIHIFLWQPYFFFSYHIYINQFWIFGYVTIYSRKLSYKMA